MQLFLLNYTDSQEAQTVRTIILNSEVWFVASDVTSILGYLDSSAAVKQHCKQRGLQTRPVPTSFGVEELLLLNESNVYRLLAKSELPSAEKFDEWLFEKVIPEIRRTGSYQGIGRTMPIYVQRVMMNYLRPAVGYFSIISELLILLQARFEAAGYTIPDRSIFTGEEIRPDNSVGMLFSVYLQKAYPQFAKEYTFYDHLFPNGTEFPVRQYRDFLLSIFREFVLTDWIPNRAPEYFAKRDTDAVKYLPLITNSTSVITYSSAKSVKKFS